MQYSPGPGISRLKQLEQANPRYGWLRQYLAGDGQFLHDCLNPVAPGRTRAVVADIPTNTKDAVSIFSFPEGGDLDAFRAALTDQKRNTNVRLIFVTSISGVGEHARKKQLSNTAVREETNIPPLITRPQTAGKSHEHPIPNHRSFLPDPRVLQCVLEASDLDPAVVLRYLDQNEHLNSPARTLHLPQLGSVGGWAITVPTALRVAIDQANHVTAVVIPGRSDPSRFPGWDAAWTVIMLATEDDCLGIDFDPTASPISQVVRLSTETIAASFESSLRSLTNDQLPDILANPSFLVWLYMGPLVEAAACHTALLRREWSVLYEPYANTSAAYGGAFHRDRLRTRVREYENHLRYINTSLENLKRARPPKPGSPNAGDTDCPWWHLESVSNLEFLIADLEYLAQDLGTLKAAGDRFLTQQVSNISLQEARMSIREAMDSKRLSYVVFIFAPLSLASSFFSVQIEPLRDPAPLWVFIVTSLAILAFSTTILILVNSKKAARLWKDLKGMVLGLKDKASGLAQPAFGEQEAESPPDDKTHERDKEGEEPRTHTTNLEGTEANNKVAGGSSATQPSLAAKKRNPKKAPRNDHAARKANEALLRVTENVPNPFYRPEYKDVDISFVMSPAGTGISPSPFPGTAQKASSFGTPPSGMGESPSLPSPAQHKPTGKRPKPSTASSSGPASEFITHSGEAGSSGAEKRVSKAVPPMSPLPEVPTQVENSAEEATGSIPRYISPSSDATERGIERASEPWPASPVQDAVDPKPMNKVPSLHEAARAGDVGAVRQLLSAGAEICNIEEEDTEGKTPIQWAAEEGYEPVVRLLLERGAAAYHSSYVDRRFNTLALAAYNLHESVVKLLVEWPSPDDLKRDMVNDALLDAYETRPSPPVFWLLMRSIKTLGPQLDDAYSGVFKLATSSQDLDTLEAILNAIKDPETKKEEIEYGLDRALRYSFTESARLFLDAGADANGESGRPLWLAGLEGSEEIIRMLLDHGADPNNAMDGMDTPLACAARHGKPSLVRLLLKAGADPNGDAVVSNAAHSGSIPVMRLLIGAGADINVENTCGYRFGRGGPGEPLEAAAEGGHANMVRFLLRAGITLETVFSGFDSPQKKGEAALVAACRHGHEAIALLLMDAGVAQPSYDSEERSPGYGDKDLPRAAASAAVHGLATVLGRFLEAESRNPGWPAGAKNVLLDMAAGYGEEEAVLVLLQHGADVNGGESWRIPLHSAAAKGHCVVVELLLDKGADVTARSPSDGGTALHAAARAGQAAAMEPLLDRRAEINAENKAGETPLHLAAREGHRYAVEVLLGRGASINATDTTGWTAAHRAAWNKHEEVLKLLTARGADLGMETHDGFTVADLLKAGDDEGPDSPSVVDTDTPRTGGPAAQEPSSQHSEAGTGTRKPGG